MTEAKSTKAPKVQPAQPVSSDTSFPDAHHGRGGMYTVSNGQRVLVERTQADHETAAADATDALQPASTATPAIATTATE